MESDRRMAPRYSLIANVEIVEPISDIHFSGRISEISRNGCYVDILNPLPIGTLVHMGISRDNGLFVAAGKIVYAQDGMGMGVAFTEIPADQMEVLDSWLEELKD